MEIKRGSMNFERVKYSGVDGVTKVRYTQDTSDKLNAFYIEAGRFGVKLNGGLALESYDDLQAFAKVLSDAWADHKKLVPKLVPTFSGH